MPQLWKKITFTLLIPGGGGTGTKVAGRVKLMVFPEIIKEEGETPASF